MNFNKNRKVPSATTTESTDNTSSLYAYKKSQKDQTSHQRNRTQVPSIID